MLRAAALSLLLSATLAGCGGEVATSPDAFSIDPLWLTQLRGPQQVTLVNGMTGEAKYRLVTASNTWVVDVKQLTDTAIVALRRALEKQGVTAGAKAGKTVTFRVQVRGASAMEIPNVVGSARLTLEADFADGTATSADGENGSAFGMARAFEGAVQSALHRLLIDEKFIAYMNR